MTDTHDDGGPAFPTQVDIQNVALPNGGYQARYVGGESGMTLEDWFAGQALAGMLASTSPDDIFSVNVLANDAYNTAAAMIAEKRRREGIQDATETYIAALESEIRILRGAAAQQTGPQSGTPAGDADNTAPPR